MSLLDPALALYVAAAVALVVWLAIFFYLWSLDRRTRELRDRLEARTHPEQARQPQAPLQPTRNHPAQGAEAAEER